MAKASKFTYSLSIRVEANSRANLATALEEIKSKINPVSTGYNTVEKADAGRISTDNKRYDFRLTEKKLEPKAAL